MTSCFRGIWLPFICGGRNTGADSNIQSTQSENGTNGCFSVWCPGRRPVIPISRKKWYAGSKATKLPLPHRVVVCPNQQPRWRSTRVSAGVYCLFVPSVHDWREGATTSDHNKTMWPRECRRRRRRREEGGKKGGEGDVNEL